MLENLLGLAGSLVSFVMWLPQARITWVNRRSPAALAGLSTATQYFVISSALVWGAYALETGAYWAGASGLVTAPLALGTIAVIRSGRRPQRRTTGLVDSVTSAPR